MPEPTDAQRLLALQEEVDRLRRCQRDLAESNVALLHTLWTVEAERDRYYAATQAEPW